MRVFADDQIDLERVVSDPDYRRDVIVYLNTQAHPGGRTRAVQWPNLPASHAGTGACRAFHQPTEMRVRKTG